MKRGRQMTHDHVLQGALGQPAVEEHRDEDVPYRGPEDLRNIGGLYISGGHVVFPSSPLLTW